MKKVLLFTLLCIAGVGYSQDKKVTFGLNVGYSSSWSSEKSEITTTTNKQMSDMSSILFGGLVNYKLSDIFSIQGEVLYVKKGFRRDLDYIDATDAFRQTQEYSINRLEVPVLVKLSFTKSKALFFMTGASPSFALSSKYVADVTQTKPTSFSKTFNENSIPNLNSFDLPIVFALGFERPIGKTTLGLQLRYNQSLMDYIDVVDSKVSSFNLIAGIRF